MQQERTPAVAASHSISIHAFVMRPIRGPQTSRAESLAQAIRVKSCSLNGSRRIAGAVDSDPEAEGDSVASGDGSHAVVDMTEPFRSSNGFAELPPAPKSQSKPDRF